jgi:hypothetical protein
MARPSTTYRAHRRNSAKAARCKLPRLNHRGMRRRPVSAFMAVAIFLPAERRAQKGSK